MKNIIKPGFIILLALFLAAVFSSCDNVLALGDVLNLNGPTVTITAPAARQPVDGKFLLEGTAKDKTDVDRVSVKVMYSKEVSVGLFADSEYEKQWRWNMTGPAQSKGWEVSIDSGKTWEPAPDVDIDPGDGNPVPISAEWSGDKTSYTWKLPIDLSIPTEDFPLGKLPPEGQYQFNVTAWNPAGNSDSNSFKTRTVTLSKELPLVSIITPFLYKLKTNTELVNLSNPENIEDRQNPLFLSKFMNGPLPLQWQIDSTNDIWSIDIRFYKANALDDDWETDYDYLSVPQDPGRNYVYRINVNADILRPPAPDLEHTVKPNGRVILPDFSTAAPNPITGVNPLFDPSNPPYGEIVEELRENITSKTLMYVVVFCKDSAGNPLEEDSRFQGYFVYWPDADIPWITFPSGLKETYAPLENMYMGFPDATVPNRAYDDDGIDRVVYTVSSVIGTGPEVITQLAGYPKTLTNENGSRVFSWSFNAPLESGIYEVEAQAFDINKRPSDVSKGRFEIKDVSFPDIQPPTKPLASNPLFRHITGTSIDNWTIDIEGIASDYTGISSVSMVWINPHSVNYAAMSQLAYFRDDKYHGWQNAPASHTDPPFPDKTYDETNYNKVWTMDITSTPRVYNGETNRYEYVYKKTLNLKTDLNIAPGQTGYDYLKSQIFVFKATDMDGAGKSTIIAWAPQGDSEAPKVKINRVTINRADGSGGANDVLARNPVTGSFDYVLPLRQFSAGDVITVEGTWEEDSAGDYTSFGGNLNIIQSILRDNLIIKIGKDGYLEGTDINVSPNTSKAIFPATGRAESGTWTAQGRMGSDSGSTLIASSLKDTLVVSATLTDLGMNISEDGASWLIQSDELRFLRVGSDTGDGTYSEFFDSSPTEIDIYLEFNKPVILVPGRTPELVLNTTPEARAVYNADHPDHHEGGLKTNEIIASSRQHFKYIVGPTDTTNDESLNLTHLAGNAGGAIGDNLWNNSPNDASLSSYPYIWKTDLGEEIRMVESAKAGQYTFRHDVLPVSTAVSAADYLFTLRAGKHIVIDTKPPVLASFAKNVKDGWYGKSSYLYFTATFDESVQIGTGANAPRLVMNLKKTGTSGALADIRTTDVQVNDKQVIFSYEIVDNDYTPNTGDTSSNPAFGGYLTIKGIEGVITDLAQNQYSNVSFSSTTFDRDSGANPPGILQVKAVKPPTPTLNVMRLTAPSTWVVVEYIDGITTKQGTSGGDSYSWDPGSYADSAAFDTSFPAGSTNIVRMKNLYIDNLYIGITPGGSPGGQDYQRVEYSVNYGKDWALYETPYATPKQRTAPGQYDLTARQIDMAGNVSDWTKPVTLNWDNGDLLTRITSSSANGIYTNTTALVGGTKVDKIPITLYFRRPVTFIQDPPIFTLSAVDGTNNKIQISVPLSLPYGPVEEFEFVYEVGQYDTTNGAPLDVEVISITAEDSDGVPISHLINRNLAIANQTLLKDLKKIIIQTGAPIRTLEPYFYDVSGQGVKEDDSHWTTIGFGFDRNVYKGGSMLWNGGTSAYDIPNEITIIQKAEDFRIPAVLTEAQWALYNKIPNIENYYTRGTNGYINGSGADLSNKYILNWEYDTDDIPMPAGPSPSPIQVFAEALRQAEKIVLPVNSSSVAVTNSGSTHLIAVTLNYSNALKVPGASYEINFPAGFVQDVLGNPCDGFSDSKSPPAGASKPVIRVSTPQDTITKVTGSSTQPSLVAVRPGKAELKMDSRTPNSVIRYTETPATTSTNYLANNNADWTTTSGLVSYSYLNDPGQPGLPGASSTLYPDPDNPGPREIGPDPSNNLYQGYKLRIRARGAVGSTLSAFAAEEVIYRTVLTFKGINTDTTKSNLVYGAGDQVWVRGGDTLYGATISGFPLSSVDNYQELRDSKKRAGIRLMTRVDGTTLLGSTWQWVTWELRTIAYISVYLGRDNDSTAAEAWQYGPLMAASQTGNWSMAKASYGLLPGGHRWLNSVNPDFTDYRGSNTPALTWSTAFDQRPPGYSIDSTNGYKVTATVPPGMTQPTYP